MPGTGGSTKTNSGAEMKTFGIGGITLAMCVALLAPAALAQADWGAVTLSDSVVAFGSVATGVAHSHLLTLANHLDSAVEVTSAAFGSAVFTTDLTGLVPLEVPAHGTYDFHVYFTAGQNVDYSDVLLIDLDGGARSLAARVSASAQYPDTYYSVTQNKWAEQLKDVLTDLIDGHTALGYNAARDNMYGSIDNVGGWVTCVYTGRTAFFNTRAGANANNFNCEHTWPQSFSNSAEPMMSDIFHLYPTDVTANSMRADLDFGKVTTTSWTVGGSKLGTDSQGQQVFEPRDAHKGNVARTIFYYVIRYNGAYNQWQNAAKMEGWLRPWHVSDPPDAAEHARNESIYALQHNRNPFIDHPELVDRISSFFGTAVRTIAPEIAVAPLDVSLGTVSFDSTACYYIAVANSGDDTLRVTSVGSTDPDFTVGETSFTVAPGAYKYLSVCYTAGEVAGSDSTDIVIASNDASEPTVTVDVSVEVGAPAGVDGGGSADVARGEPRLYQNSPNPFVGLTTIAFNLPGSEEASLAIYNIRGRLVAQVFGAQMMSAGEHRVAFAGGGLPAGLYYYRLVVGGRALTKSMVLIGK
jgi:endonuclease I